MAEIPLLQMPRRSTDSNSWSEPDDDGEAPAAETDSVDNDLYSSLPLIAGSKTIRVFDLEPFDPDRPDSKIRGTLRVVDVTNQPHFVALSYVWGSWSHPRRTILCGKHSMEVTDNLYDALSHLRRDPRGEDPGRNSDGSITLWIDAICINQSDDDEINDQIPLMGDIYGCSSSLCIWMGKGSKDSDAAADYFQTAGWQSLLKPEGDFFYSMPGHGIVWKAALRNAGLRLLPSSWMKKPTGDVQGNVSFSNVDEFLENVWVHRIWTLQEAALAHQPWVRFGTRRLTWRTMLYTIAYLSWGPRNLFEYGFAMTRYRPWKRTMDLWLAITRPHRDGLKYAPTDITSSVSQFEQALTDYTAFMGGVSLRSNLILYFLIWLGAGLVWGALMTVFSVVPAIRNFQHHMAQIILGVWLAIVIPLGIWGYLNMRKRPNISSKQTVLGAVVQEIWLRRSTKPQDKVYGVHAVMGKLGVQLDAPDKNATYSDLYRGLFRKLLDTTRNLNLVLGAGGAFEGQPSWVPDWSLEETDHWIPPSMYLEEEAAYSTIIGPSMFVTWGQTTPGSPSLFEFGTPGELVMEGWQIGVISWRGESFVSVDDALSERLVTAPATNTNPYVRNAEILQQALERRQTLEDPSNDYVPYILGLPLGSQQLSSDFDYLTAKKTSLGPRPVDWEQPAAEIASILSEGRSDWQEHVRKVCNLLAERRRTLFWTDGPLITGIGNCPTGTNVGDEIVLLSGVALPVILRKVEDTKRYRLVGYAILESEQVMEGKLWTELSSKDEDLQTFAVS